MPSRNIIKKYSSEQYYHIYSRGVNKQVIFHEEADYLFYLSLFKRYLSTRPAVSKRHGTYPHYANDIEILAYCLMPNHIHILVYQHDERAITSLLRSIMTAYSRFYNTKYSHSGPVFQSRYLASLIDQEDYLHHISRYIHLNPKNWETYPYSSLRYYTETTPPDWLHTDKVMSLFNQNQLLYKDFLKDYSDHKQMLDELKWELAHSGDMYEDGPRAS